MTRYFIIIVLSCISFTNAFAQIRVRQSVEPVAMYIGEQAHLKIEVTARKNSNIVFPTHSNNNFITPGVELLEMISEDTINLDNDIIQVSRSYNITSFDEGLYSIPGTKIKVDGREYETKTTALKVITVDVDTVHTNQFFQNKEIQNNPFSWYEDNINVLFYLSILVILLIFILVYLYIRLKQNKPIISVIKIIKRIPAHQRALSEIDKIKNENLIEKEENTKLYYTKLTDTLRKYIKERFGFNALEMTSTQIIENLQKNDDEVILNELREIFKTADLVKFAKYSTQVSEKDYNLINAIKFIDSTKKDEQVKEEKVVPLLTENEKRIKLHHITSITLMTIILTIIIAILIYIAYKVYELLV